MKNNTFGKNLIKICKNGGLFAGLLILTFYIIFKDNSISDFADAVSRIQFRYIAVGMAFMMIFCMCEALNIARSLKMFGYGIGFFRAVKYAMAGFFFSAVTPSSSGGQPMQLYYMHKDKIAIPHATLALLFELLSFELMSVIMSFSCYIYQRQLIAETMGSLKYLLLIGIGLNCIMVVILVAAIFSRKMIVVLTNLFVSIIRVFSKSKSERIKFVLDEQVAEYQSCAVYFKENKMIFVKTLLTTLIQITMMYSVPFLVYRGFGFSEFSAFEVIAMQSVLYVAVSALPLPGALGISESTFMILFKTMFPAQLLGSAMLISRTISFYICVLITGIVMAVVTLKIKGDTRYEIYNSRC